MKIALLSNVTTGVLAGMLSKRHDVWTPSGFDTWMETALEPPRDLISFDPDIVCLLIDRRYGVFDAVCQRIDAAIASLHGALVRSSVIVPDVTRLAADFGDRFYDEKMWKLGRMPFSLCGLREIERIFTPKKVLATDLDNTLWKGVIGEDGAGGIEPDAELQGKLLELKRRGVLLAIISKNNAADVTPVWKDARMVLGADDFVASAIDWNDKAVNLVRLAKELGLGADSFVFVDDDPFERASMRARLPDVTVADFPPQLDVYFPKGTMTAEDAIRSRSYRDDIQRRELASGLSVDDYIKELRVWSEIRLARDEDVARIAQLSIRTNQFNTCTNRYTEKQIRSFLSDARRLLFVVWAGDRFGDYGLISFVHVLIEGSEAEIVDWVMSCRAMNRRLEFSVERELERALTGRGVSRIRAKWRNSGKNAVVSDIFERFDFQKVGFDGVESIYQKKYQKKCNPID